MVGLQEFIHKLELGEGVRWVRWTAVILSLLTLALAYDLLLFRNFSTEEAMDAAQLARNIAEGKGFTTSYVRPFSIYTLQQRQVPDDALLKANHPDLANAPLYPILLAAYMKIMPFHYGIADTEKFYRFQPELLIAFFNQFWFFLALYLVYHLGKRLFSPGVGWLACGIMACTELFWRVSISGHSTLMTLVLLLGAVWCLMRLEEGGREVVARPGWWFMGWAALAGLALGLGTLTRYSLGWLLIPILGFCALYLGARRKTAIVVVTLCFCATLAPWLARNYQISGKLFGIAGYAVYEDSTAFPETSFMRQLKPEPIKIDQYSVEDILRKLVTNGREIVQKDLVRCGGSWLAAIFLASLLVPLKKPGPARLRIFLLWLLVSLVVIQAIGRTHLSHSSPEISGENMLLLAAPLMFIFAAGLCVHLLGQVEVAFPEMKILMNLVVWAVLSLPLVLAFLPTRPSPISYPPYYPWLIQRGAGFMKDNELMMSDIPWAVAWYGQRQSVHLCLNLDDFQAIDMLKFVKALYLTQVTTDARFLSHLIKGEDKVWGRFYLDIHLRGSVPPGFPLKDVWTDVGVPDQLFVADWARWGRSGK